MNEINIDSSELKTFLEILKIRCYARIDIDTLRLKIFEVLALLRAYAKQEMDFSESEMQSFVESGQMALFGVEKLKDFKSLKLKKGIKKDHDIALVESPLLLCCEISALALSLSKKKINGFSKE